eukprot:COSAG06_NODE_65213_length_257_cov_1.278481_1_plen_51_part_10
MQKLIKGVSRHRLLLCERMRKDHMSPVLLASPNCGDSNIRLDTFVSHANV